MTVDIDYLTAGTSSQIENLQSAIREVTINNLIGFDVYCEDSAWKVKITAHNGPAVLIAWRDFVNIVHNLSQFVAQESEYLIKKKQSDDLDDEI